MKLYFKDLPCYQGLTEEEKLNKLYTPNSAFDLSKLPNDALRAAFAPFIFDRAATLGYLSLASERTHFHNMARFLSIYYPELDDITAVPLDEMVKKAKMHLMKKKQPPVYFGNKADRNGEYKRANPNISYLKTVYDYFLPTKDKAFDKEDDIWKIDKIPFSLRASPITSATIINFSKIPQDKVKAEIKEAVLYNLKRLALSTVFSQIYAVSYLSVYLSENFPDIRSLKDFDRELLEEYLGYIYLECKRRTDYRGELISLKSILNTVGKLFSYDNLRVLFLNSDFQKSKRTIYRSYSDSELERLHEAYRQLDKQTARLLLIHELLGLRISDTMTLKKEDVIFGDEAHIKISQPKTDEPYIKKISPELETLLKASIEETERVYGETAYIFVSDKDPDKPLTYSTLRYRLEALIRKLDLRDDNGNLLKPETHIFRHTYGKKLCDMYFDDATIAAMLGHKSLSSVQYYRQMSPKVLVESVKPVLDARDEMIRKHKRGWML